MGRCHKWIMKSLVFGRELGRGQFSRVFEASLETGEKFAVKQIDPEHVGMAEREAAILRQCAHPFVVRLIEQDGNSIMMELCESSLLQKIKDNTSLKTRPMSDGEREALQTCAQLGLALAKIHSTGNMHRDLKPANVFLRGGEVRLGDFGFSTSDQRMSDSRKGTPYYMAPEILESREYNRAVDVWSFGCILFELITCRTPFVTARTEQDLYDLQRSPLPIPLVLNASTQDLIRRLLSHDPSERISISSALCHPALAPFVSAEATKNPLVLAGTDVTLALLESGSSTPLSALGPLPRVPSLPDQPPPHSRPLRLMMPSITWLSPPPDVAAWPADPVGDFAVRFRGGSTRDAVTYCDRSDSIARRIAFILDAEGRV